MPEQAVPECTSDLQGVLLYLRGFVKLSVQR
jgi:hypothetical protein